jgi:hypothetical protein
MPTLATDRASWAVAALVLLALLLPGGAAFGHAAHHPPITRGLATLQQVVATPAVAAHAAHRAPPCCLGATCVELVPMAADLSGAAPVRAMQPAAWRPGHAAAPPGFDPSPSPRPPRRAS